METCYLAFGVGSGQMHSGGKLSVVTAAHLRSGTCWCRQPVRLPDGAPAMNSLLSQSPNSDQEDERRFDSCGDKELD